MKVWVLELNDTTDGFQVGPTTLGVYDLVSDAIYRARCHADDQGIPLPPKHEHEWPSLLPRTEDSGFYWYESPNQHNCRAWFITSHEVR